MACRCPRLLAGSWAVQKQAATNSAKNCGPYLATSLAKVVPRPCNRLPKRNLSVPNETDFWPLLPRKSAKPGRKTSRKISGPRSLDLHRVTERQSGGRITSPVHNLLIHVTVGPERPCVRSLPSSSSRPRRNERGPKLWIPLRPVEHFGFTGADPFRSLTRSKHAHTHTRCIGDMLVSMHPEG